ncbi:MAG: hypothetical protein OXU31_00170 [Gammaproteobacteria bacterium]|nr:hypothetical protein [Gammaproteobacteria bacterium]
MLTKNRINAIAELTQQYWAREVQKDYFSKLASGKEIGHRIADLVDDKTAATLTAEYLVKYEHDEKDRRKVRSMGDVWVEEDKIYYPINIKTGIVGQEGQPNLVSIKKLMMSLLEYRIDSYYLLMVKFDLPKLDSGAVNPPRGVSCKTYMVDMLDYLDCVTFDAGPGQTMLKAKKFFSSQAGNASIDKQPLQHKIKTLLALLEDGQERLIKNRRDSLKIYQNKVQDYLQSKRLCVTVEAQKVLNLK